MAASNENFSAALKKIPIEYEPSASSYELVAASDDQAEGVVWKDSKSGKKAYKLVYKYSSEDSSSVLASSEKP